MAEDKINKAALEFWDWFNQNQQTLSDEFTGIGDGTDGDNPQAGPTKEAFEKVERVLGEMMDHLHKYDDRLFPYCGLSPEGQIELIITAEGNVEAFESVHELVDEAPELDNWKIMALKPRTVGLADDFEIFSTDGQEEGQSGVGPGSIQYSIIKMESEVILLLVFDSEEDELEEEAAFMGVNLVEAMLGEQDLATGFDAIDIMTTSHYERTKQEWPLSDLSSITREFDQRRLH